MIFSATASNTNTLERSEEFYSCISRANVAFSRTKRRLIVIASRTFLEHMPVSYSRYEGMMLWRQLRRMCIPNFLESVPFGIEVREAPLRATPAGPYACKVTTSTATSAMLQPLAMMSAEFMKVGIANTTMTETVSQTDFEMSGLGSRTPTVTVNATSAAAAGLAAAPRDHPESAVDECAVSLAGLRLAPVGEAALNDVSFRCDVYSGL